MAATRKSISKRLRFEVFKRDSFTCQYCGRSAPDVVLHVDHIQPVSKGGETTIMNLVTSCRDCNLGKSNKLLSDSSAVKKRKQQLDDLQARQEQLEMIMEWQKTLIDLDEQIVKEIAAMWDRLTDGYSLNKHGLANIKKWLAKYSVDEIVTAMRTSTTQYLRYTNMDDELPTSNSAEHTFRMIPHICKITRLAEKYPYLKQLYYARGILRNRLEYVKETQSINLMKEAVLAGTPAEEIVECCKTFSTWDEFETAMLELSVKETPPNA